MEYLSLKFFFVGASGRLFFMFIWIRIILLDLKRNRI